MKLLNAAILFLLIWLTACGPKTSNKPITDTTMLIKAHEIVSNVKDNNPYVSLDVSPMDMCYFPPNYQQLRMSDSINTDPVLRIIYSRPHLQGRKLFYDILKYGQPWRLGANEATELDVYQPISIAGKKLTKGRYTLYCIPKENEWTIAINAGVDIWGLKMDSTKDVMRVIAPITKGHPHIEYFTMVFEKSNGHDGTLLMGWQDILARLSFKY